MTDDPYSGLLATPVPGVDVPTDTVEPETTDLECQVCGTPLVYAGRGRKPKFCDEHKSSGAKGSTSNGNRSRASGDVEVAMQAMDTLYSGVTMVLMAISPAAATQFAEASVQAQMANRVAFESDRSLVKTITKGAGKSAKPMFLATQVMLIGPVARIAANDLAARRTTPKGRPVSETFTAPAAPTSGAQPDGSYIDPVDLAFQRAQRR